MPGQPAQPVLPCAGEGLARPSSEGGVHALVEGVGIVEHVAAGVVELAHACAQGGGLAAGVVAVLEVEQDGVAGGARILLGAERSQCGVVERRLGGRELHGLGPSGTRRWRQHGQEVLLGAHHGERQLLIGLDGGNPNVRRYTTDFTPLEELCGYITLAAGGEEPVPAWCPRDEFGTAIPHELVRLDEMPLTDCGGIDREALAALA